MRNTPSPRFLGIQVLRIVAACLVVVTHSTFYASERLDRHLSIWQRGTRGVDIFFVISGFVMVYSSQKLLSEPNGWLTFARHRVLRIVPLYWTVTSLKVLIVLSSSGWALHTLLTPATAFCSYFFLPARNLDGRIEPLVGVGWTLNFEMFFYFLFAIALFSRINVFRFIGPILIALSIAALFRQPNWPPAAFYLNSIVLEFLFGMLIARACIRQSFIPRALAGPLLICGFILLICPPESDWSLPKALVSGVPASLIVWSTASLKEYDSLIPRSLLYLGNASYSIYLIHPFVSPIAPSVLSHLHLDYPWLSVTTSVLIGVGAGCGLHKVIETPMTTLLKRHLQGRSKPLAVA